MGVDVVLYAEGDISDEEVEAARAFIVERVPPSGYDELERSKHPSNRVTWWNGDRYYGVGYERGDWPSIYGRIMLMRAAFPNATIFYGNDCSDEVPEATDDALSGLWEHFLGPHGADYRRSFR